jgi:hypothetical protein
MHRVRSPVVWAVFATAVGLVGSVLVTGGLVLFLTHGSSGPADSTQSAGAIQTDVQVRPDPAQPTTPRLLESSDPELLTSPTVHPGRIGLLAMAAVVVIQLGIVLAVRRLRARGSAGLRSRAARISTGRRAVSQWLFRHRFDIAITAFWLTVSLFPWWQISYPLTLSPGVMNGDAEIMPARVPVDAWHTSISWLPVLLAIVAVVPTGALQATGRARRWVNALLAWVALAMVTAMNWPLPLPLPDSGVRGTFVVLFGSENEEYLSKTPADWQFFPWLSGGAEIGLTLVAVLMLLQACLLTGWATGLIKIPSPGSEETPRWLVRHRLDIAIMAFWLTVSLCPWWQGCEPWSYGGSERYPADAWHASINWLAVLLAIIAVLPTSTLRRAASPARWVNALLAWVALAMITAMNWPLPLLSPEEPVFEATLFEEDMPTPQDWQFFPWLSGGQEYGLSLVAALMLLQACLLTGWASGLIKIPGSRPEQVATTPDEDQ